MEYHYQLAIMTSPAYKELHNQYKGLKEQNRREKEERLKVCVSIIEVLKEREE